MKKIFKWLLWGLFALSTLSAFIYLWSNGQEEEVLYKIVFISRWLTNSVKGI